MTTQRSSDSEVAVNSMDRYMIDVGGVLYCSTIQTLSKSPTLKSLIERHDDEETLVFIDRDGSAFQHVLNFLRNGTVYAIEDRAFAEFLINEAGFFGLRKMEAQISKQLSERRRHDLHDIVLELRAMKLHMKALTDYMLEKPVEGRRPMSRASSSSSALNERERSNDS